MEKSTVILALIFVLIGYFLWTQSNQSAVGVQTVNGTTAQPPLIIDIGKADLLPWGIAILLLIYLLWQHRKGSGQGYKNEQEATQDIRTRFRALQVFPIRIENFHFTNPDNKIEARGNFRCTNQQYAHYNEPIWFEIRKNGALAYDPKAVVEPLPPRPKTRFIVKTKAEQKKEGEKR